MKKLDEYFALQEQIFEYFGYVENWRAFPLDDARSYFWHLEGEGPGLVCFADTEAELEGKDGQYYENVIYTQRHLERWVYRGPEFTMVVADTRTDGNKFLQVFDNAKERVRALVDASSVALR